jgi:hypothetical protein
MHRVKHLGGLGIPKNMGLRTRQMSLIRATFRNVLHSPISLCIIKLIKHKLKVMHSKVSFFVFEKVLCFTLGRLATTGLP